MKFFYYREYITVFIKKVENIKKSKNKEPRAAGFIEHNEDVEKIKNRKWIIVSVFFSFTILSAMCALFIPGSKGLLDINVLFIYIFFIAIFFLGFRFKKAAGIPLLFLFIFCFLIIVLFFQTLTSFTGETEIAKLHVLKVKENEINMELVLPDNRYKMLKIKGEYFAPVVKVIIFEDFLVFFGAKTWYRFTGIMTFPKENESEILMPMESFNLEKEYGISRNIYQFIEEYEEFIPGIKSVQREVVQKKAKKLTSYSIRVQNDGGVIVEITE